MARILTKAERQKARSDNMRRSTKYSLGGLEKKQAPVTLPELEWMNRDNKAAKEITCPHGCIFHEGKLRGDCRRPEQLDCRMNRGR